jgi:hypothetical protein
VTGIEDVDGVSAYRAVQTLARGGTMTGFYGVDWGLLLKLGFTSEAERRYPATAASVRQVSSCMRDS